MTAKEYEDILRMDAEKYDYKIKSEERLKVLATKFKAQVEAHGEMYCPCQPNHNEATICPCHYMRVHGACRCGLYEVKE